MFKKINFLFMTSFLTQSVLGIPVQEGRNIRERTQSSPDTSKATFINNAENKVADLDFKIMKMRAARDYISPDSNRYQMMTGVLLAMETELADARLALLELRASSVPDWTAYRTRIDAKLANAKRAHESVLAE